MGELTAPLHTPATAKQLDMSDGLVSNSLARFGPPFPTHARTSKRRIDNRQCRDMGLSGREFELLLNEVEIT